MRKLRIIGGLTISVICLAVVLARLDFTGFGEQLTTLHPLPLLAFVAIQLVEIGIRAQRWRGLVTAVAEEPGYPRAFRAYAAGYLFNSTLPARLGEYVRAVMLASRSPFSAPLVLGTVVVERLQDLAILSALVVGAALFLAPPLWIYRAAAMGTGAFLVGCVVLVLAGRIWHGRLRSMSAFESFRTGISSMRDTRATGRSLLLAGIAWGADAAALAVVLRAFDIHLGIPGVLLVMAIVSLGMAIPAGPAGVGTHQVAFIGALSLFGVAEPKAVAISIVVQVLTVTLFALAGAASLSVEGLTRSAVLTQAQALESDATARKDTRAKRKA